MYEWETIRPEGGRRFPQRRFAGVRQATCTERRLQIHMDVLLSEARFWYARMVRRPSFDACPF